MAVYRNRKSRFWWISVYRAGKSRVRVSSGTENRIEAEVMERTLKLAQGGTTPRARLHAALDALLGAEETGETGVALAGLWDAAR
jgi:hypothetical protein